MGLPASKFYVITFEIMQKKSQVSKEQENESNMCTEKNTQYNGKESASVSY